MATVLPFRAWRYDTARVGGLAQVTAPAYDTISPKLQAELYERSPFNVVRIDFGKTSQRDTDEDNRYTRAAALVNEWKQSGVLVRDPRPSVTVVEESFRGLEGKTWTRRGFLALIRLADFDESVVFPHETTLSGPKEDRYKLMPGRPVTLRYKVTLFAE